MFPGHPESSVMASAAALLEFLHVWLTSTSQVTGEGKDMQRPGPAGANHGKKSPFQQADNCSWDL